MTRAVADILRAAKERIGTPERWCKGHGSANGYADPSVPTCAEGAIYCVAKQAFVLAYSAWNAFQDCNGLAMCSGVDWNDAPERTHAEVMAAFDRAIAAEEAS